MAESITEGTLKQFSKKVGDYVEADEEIATIETDKVGPTTFGATMTDDID
jgi:2-oxoglutarate dehydrogenase E2 component (dihydrolipoamide succinyltransferase)